MNRFLQWFKASPEDLLTSRLYNEQLFYREFVRDIKHCKREVVIESPYLTERRVLLLLPALSKLTKRGVRVVVTTRNPQEHDAALRIQAYKAIPRLYAAGVDLRLVTGHHHRKLAILDGIILWEGSLNILSQNYSAEVMRRIESKPLSRQMRRFIGY